MCSSLNQWAFFKLLIGDFSSKLLIPVEFSRRYKEILPRKLRLQTQSEKFWTVKIEQINEKHYFMEGWREFVDGNQLGEGEFLVFEFVRRSTFKVAIFTGTGCEKGFPSFNVDRSVSERIGSTIYAQKAIKVED